MFNVTVIICKAPEIFHAQCNLLLYSGLRHFVHVKNRVTYQKEVWLLRPPRSI